MRTDNSKRHNGNLLPKFLLLVLDVPRKEFTAKLLRFKKNPDDKDERWHDPKNWTISTYNRTNKRHYEYAMKLSAKISYTLNVMHEGRGHFQI